MDNIGWIIASVGAAVLVPVAGIIMSQRMRTRTISQELSYLTTLGGGLVSLGIVFSSDRLIGYSFIGAGVVLSIISVIKSKRKEQRSAMEMR